MGSSQPNFNSVRSAANYWP